MGFNETNPIIKTSSDGVWQGEPTLHYAFPLLIIQTTLVVFLSRLLAFLLKPLRQPKVIAEILVSFEHCQYILSFYFKECYTDPSLVAYIATTCLTKPSIFNVGMILLNVKHMCV